MLFRFEESLLPDQMRSVGLSEKDEKALFSQLSKEIAKIMASTMVAGRLPFGDLGPRLTELANAMAATALGRSVVLRLQPELSDAERQSVRTFTETLVRVTETVDEARLEAAIGKLAEVLLPDDLERARGILAADNVDLRDRFMAEVPHLSSTDVNKLAGSNAKNSYATAARWKKNGDIFSLSYRGSELFPAFQFEDGRPHPAIKRVLQTLPASMTNWQRALWFVTANGWLDDDEPIDRLDDVEALETAARHEHEEVVG
ncbi:hypothetical protein RJJ65_30440 [Rhizobium hidalgonense]|uniref:Uncharacterized protein n=1 Tax=Rhizobium hidalgonense TaxID=1538159 RepID=A0A2A6K948_9HYPH|nr:hypothetical protein [Rhizobium hidalgonense]MDR9776898.1 hypothetical protein [Rhizobium hidalgonense]MDR9813941.1 hypothetical protein [Rhizobium hidalgonense]MDR9820741.1 hypothetical protein [Rhizobium hidalgonense]PDT21426.1 hypothetical protein CO674_22840 [Rhizobium hidalgonense]PON08083.1 hypothetical protein ATY29_08430 [Rhizobium hidalgonense]